MHIVSYRGPGMAGGVSSALARAWDTNLGGTTLWWHLQNEHLQLASGPDMPAQHIASLPDEVIKGHYRFCNEFLWPIMHDLPEQSRFVPQDYYYYQTFNQTLGWCILRMHNTDRHADFFVQDYQMALLPQFMRANAGFRSVVFWHIPWPKQVDQEHVPYIMAIAKGLLGAEYIGFHTSEYAENFLNFVAEYCHDYTCDNDKLTALQGNFETSQALAAAVGFSNAPSSRQNINPIRHSTTMVVAPLGIDFENWSALAAGQDKTLWHPSLMRKPFILSVDRADYTKGIVERIKAIDTFFERHPEKIGTTVFAQVCGRTRSGLTSFENYWAAARQLYDDLTARWSTNGWQPMLWIENPMSSAELALAYRNATAMLVNPLRDGLNLTAKEFIACQGNQPGVLALSEGAGTWHEIGSHAVTVDPHSPEQMSEALYKVISMDAHERHWRMTNLKEQVRANTLNSWWHTFDSLLADKVKPAVRMSYLKEIS